MSHLNIDFLQAVKAVAEAQRPIKSFERDIANGVLDDDKIVQQSKARAALRLLKDAQASEPRTSNAMTAKDYLAGIANHLNAAGVEHDAKPGHTVPDGKRREGDIVDMVFYDADNRPVKLSYGQAAAVYSFLKTFYPND